MNTQATTTSEKPSNKPWHKALTHSLALVVILMLFPAKAEALPQRTRFYGNKKSYLIEPEVNVPEDVIERALLFSEDHYGVLASQHRASQQHTMEASNHIIYGAHGCGGYYHQSHNVATRWTSTTELGIINNHQGMGGPSCSDPQFTYKHGKYGKGKDTVFTYGETSTLYGHSYGFRFSRDVTRWDRNAPTLGQLVLEDVRPINGNGRRLHPSEGIEPDSNYMAHMYIDARDADCDLGTMFFDYKDVHRNIQGTFLREEWRHPFHKGRFAYDKGRAWVDFDPKVGVGGGSGPAKPGLYEFTAYAEDKEGHRSKRSNAVRVQIWGPPEIQHVQIAPEMPMRGQEITVSIDFFDPNGDLARYNVEMWEAPEGEAYTLKETHKADFPKKGARSHMAYTFHPEKPGRYLFKAECWDARKKKSQVFEQVLTVESVPEVVYGTLEDGRPAKSLTDKRSLLESLIKGITSTEHGDLELVVSACDGERLCLNLNSRTEDEDPKSIFEGRYLTSGDAFVVEADTPESLLATVEDGGRSLVFELGDEDSEEGTVRLVLYPSGDIQIEELSSKGVLRIKTPGNIITGPAEAKALFLDGKTILNDAHLEADILELTASEDLLNGTQQSEGAHLLAKESATFSAQHFENHGIVEAPVLTLNADSITNGSDSNEAALGKLTTSDLELTCETGTNFGLIGPNVSLEDTTTQVDTGVLRFKVGAFTNAKAIHGSILEFTVSGTLDNTVSGLINPASQLIVSGEGVFTNAGDIKAPGSLELRMAGLDNTGNITAEGGIAFYEGAEGTSNTGTLASPAGEISIRTNGIFLNKAGSTLTAKNLRIDQKSLDNTGTIKVLGSATIGLASLINQEPGIIRGEHFDLRTCASFVNHGHFQPESLDGELMSIQGAGTVSIGKLNIDVQTDLNIENTLTCRDTCTLNSTGHIVNKGSLFALSESCIDQDDCTDESHFSIHAAQGFINDKDAVVGSTGTLKLTADAGDIVNKGMIHARNRIELDTLKGFINNGTMNGAGAIVASSGDYMNNLPAANISMGGHFNGTTTGTFLNQGKIKTLGQGHIKAGTIRNEHLIDLREPSTLEADTIENFNQALPGKKEEGTLLDLAASSKVQANELLHNRGSIRAADDSIIKGKRIFNDGAAASIFGSSKLTIEAEETIDNISAQILSLGLLHLHAKKIINDREYSSPELVSKGEVEIAKIIAQNLILEGHDLINHTSVVYAYEDLLAYINNITNQGIQKTHKQEIPTHKRRKLGGLLGSSTSGGGFNTIVDGTYEALLAAGGNVESVLGNGRWSHGMFNKNGHRVINKFARIVAGKKITFTEDDISGIIEFYNSICKNIGLIQVSVDFNRLYKGEALQTVLTDPYGSPLSSRYLSPEENSEFAYVCNFQQGIDDLINQGYMTEEFVYARPAAFATDEKTAHILKILETPPRFFLDPVLEAHSMMVASMVHFETPHLLKGSSNVLDESLKLSGKAIELAGRQEALPYSAETILLSDPDQAEALESSSLQRMNEAGGLVNIGGLQVESGMWVISDETIRTSEEIFKYYTLGVLDTATGRILEHEDPAQYLVPVHKKIAKDKETSREASPETETQYRLATPAGLEVVMVPILAIPNNFVPLGGSIDLTTPNFIGGGEGTEINLSHANVHNAGGMGSALGDVEINVASFVNEKPVYTYETYESGKGLLGSSFRQTFEVRIPQPGGDVIGVNIRIRSVNDIENKGGHIAAEKEVEIFSEHGDIRNLAQRYSEVVHFDVGKLGALLGKKSAALKEFLVPGTISAGGSLNLTSEDGRIIFVASDAFADTIHLKAKEGIDIQGETTTYTVANRAGLRGVKIPEERREKAIHFPSRFIARDSITLESSEGDITVQGSYIIAGGDITQKAGRDNIVKVDRVRLKSSSSKAGFTTFGYTSSKTTVSEEKLYPSFYIAGGNIRLEADRDNRLEALIIDAGEAIELISGRDTIITAAEAHTNVETKSKGFSLDFFASKAIELADNGASDEAIIKSLIAEDPLGAALLGYDHIGDWQDALATTTNVGVQTYRLLYSLARVNGQAIDGIVSTRFGTIGQRLGLTDAAGKFRPRVTLRLGKSRSTQETVELLEANLHGQRVYIRAGEDIWINGGAQIIAEADIELDAGGDIHTEPGEQTQTSSSWSRGVSASIGGGLLPGIGIDGAESSSQAMANKHNLLKAGSKVILRSKGGQYYKGTVVEAPEIEVTGKRLVIESVVDTSESKSRAGSINSEGSLFASESKSSSAWVNTVSGFYGSQSVNINVDEDIEIIGAVVIGPDGDTHVVSDRFCYRNVDEYGWSKSTSVNAGFIWDMRNMQFGSGIPVTIDTDYHHTVEEGTTHATIAGDDSIDGINHDRDTIQTRNVVKDKHVRVFVPVIDPLAFRESLDVIKSAYFKPGEQPDFDGFKDKLYEAASVEADEAVEVSDSSEEGITVAFLGDEDARLVHTLIEVPVGSDETGLERIVIEEIVDLNAAQGGAREVSVTYDHLLDRVEIVYAEDSVKRRVMMPGSVFRENMLGVHHEGEAVYADLMHDIEKYVVHGDYRGASPYGFEFAEGGMTEAFQAFDQRVDSSGSNSLSTSEWLEIIFSSEVGYAALGGAKEYGLGLGEGVIDAVKAPFELLELFVKATDLAVNDPDGFREKVGELTQVFSQKETYVAMLNGMAQELTTSRGIGHISGDAVAGMLVAGTLKHMRHLNEAAKIKKCELVHWGPLNGPGPLGEKIAQTFRGGSYIESVTSEPIILYRVYGGDAAKIGPYWTRVCPHGPLQSRIDSALLPEWGNSAEKVIKIEVPKGTRIFEGLAAPQGKLMGGGNQIFIQNVNPNWIMP